MTQAMSRTATAAAAAATAAGGAVLARVRAVPRDERGDVPGWVMVTLMTAGLVVALWAVAGPRLQQVFTTAMDRVVSGG